VAVGLVASFCACQLGNAMARERVAAA
jgi:DHA1 family bicyclomycin/chloramphenicol resistance-like MFS transporter